MDKKLHLRMQNKVFVVAFAASLLTTGYQLCGILGLTPPISQDVAVQLTGVIVNCLFSVGILIDPTTPGVTDGTAKSDAATPGSE